MQITKLSFLSTQSLGDSVFAVEEVIDIPIDQVFGTYRAREKALINLIGSDAVQKVDRDTWKIVKDITLEAANAVMRKGDFFRVKLDEEGDDSPIHFDLDATGVFVLSREVFASLQTYTVLEPGKEQAIRMAFTFGGKPVVDAVLTSKFSSLSLVPVDATNGIYELKFFTSMALSDDAFNIEVTGQSLRNTVYEAPVRVTVREPILSLVPVDLELHAEQTKDITWQVLMEGAPAPLASPMQAVANPQSVAGVDTDVIAKVGAFKLIDSAKAIYSLNVKATDEVGAASTIDTSYRFASNYIGELSVPVKLLSKESLYVTHQTTSLEANKTQLIQITLKLGSVAQAPVTDAAAVQINITGACIHSVEPTLIPIDPANGVYAYRVTTNHKGGPISVRAVLSTQGNPYPDFYNLTARSTNVKVEALNTLPAASTADLTFRVSQERLGGMTNLVGVIAKNFTIGGSAIAKVNGAVEAVGMGVYKVSVTTNNRGGSVPVKATLTIDGEDVEVEFSTSAAQLSQIVLSSTGPALVGETVQNVPLLVKLDGVPFDITNPSVTLSGVSYVANGAIRRTGVGTYEIVDVNVNGKGGVLNVSLKASVKGYAQTVSTAVPVDPVANVIATNVSHLRPTTTDTVKFNLTRGGVVLTSIKVGKATITGGEIAAYDGTVDILDANTGSFQIRSVTAGAPVNQAYFQISIPVVIKGYSYTVVFNSYTEAMPNLSIGGGSSSAPGAGVTVPGSGAPSGVGGNLSGGLVQSYCMYFEVNGQPANITSGTVTGSGSVLVAGPDAALELKGNGIACITGIQTTVDGGYVTVKGSIVIDGITYPLNFSIRNAPQAPDISNVTVLECESIQTLYFTMKQGVTPIPDAVLSDVKVTGDAIESFGDFALDDPTTGRYRINVVTNDKGGDVHVTLGATFVGMLYPVSFDTTAKDLSTVGDGSGWKIVSTAPTAATSTSQNFHFVRGGQAVEYPSVKDVSVTGVSVLNSTNDAVLLNTTNFKVTKVSLDSRGGDVTLKASASLNGGATWHPLETTFNLAQAPAPTVTPQAKMLVARVPAVLQFTLKRNGQPVTANTITNIQVSGTPVETAKQDLIVINAAAGIYGTTVTPNDLGGNVDVTFDLNEGGVDYPGLSFTGVADIYHPWQATLLNGPVPEIATNIDFQSHLDDGTPVAITSGTAIITGSCLVSPVDEISLVYQDSATKTYRIPNVMVNNNGGNIHIVLKVMYEGGEITQEFDYTVNSLPALAVASTGADLPFQSVNDVTFTVDRGAANPSVFTNAMVKNLSVTGAAVAGFTPTIVPVSAGNYKLSVQTNGKGGVITVAFTVTLAGIDYPISFTKNAVVEPPVTAVSTNTLQTNATSTNLDFQLMRGQVPCADSFVVTKIEINSRSVSSYPQNVINVNVSQGQYRIQVNTTAYSDPIPVTITGTVRGEPVILQFTANIVAGVLPTVSVVSSAFDENQQTAAILSFMQGTTAITSGITLDSVDGDLTNATLTASGGNWSLAGIPTTVGSIPLTINFSWKGGSYSAVVNVNVTAVYPATLITDPKLPAYKLTNVAFTMLNADGNAYPAGYTYSVDTKGAFSVISQVAQQADGSFLLGLTPPAEREDSVVMITATETATGNIRKHAFTLSSWLHLEARFSGTAPLDSTSVSNQVQFDVYEINQNLTRSVYSAVNLDSLKVVGRGDVNNITGWSSFLISSNPTYRGTFYVSANAVDVVDADFTFDYTSPLGRVYKIPGMFRLQKPMVATWTDISGQTGAVQKTLKVQLVSGNTPISDAQDATSMLTNGVINKPLYLIDAATGTYGIDVTPKGDATSMVVTLKVKQPATPTVINTFTTQTVAVTPAPITAVANTTLKRSNANGVNLDIFINQGGIAITNATINSWTISDDSIGNILKGPTNAGSGIYRWSVQTKYTGGNPQVTINATINGVGYVFNIDYPIEAETPPRIKVISAPTWAKNQPGELRFSVVIGSTLVSMDQYPLDSAIYIGPVTETSPNVQYVSARRGSFSGGYPDGTGYIMLYPLVSGAGQVFSLTMTIYGVPYTLDLPVDVVDAGSIQIVSGAPLTAQQANTVVFNMIPAAGVTYDGTETLTVGTVPSGWKITSAPVRNADGTYTMVVNPINESKGNFTINAVKGGVTYQNGSPMDVLSLWDLYFENRGFTETAVGRIGADFTLKTSSGTTPNSTYFILDQVSDRNSIKVYADREGVIDPNGSPPGGTYATSVVGFRVDILKVDYAVLKFSINITSLVTGHTYTVYTEEVNVHDAANVTWLTPSTLAQGKTYDLQFKLTYAVSGNPVTNAVASTTVATGSGFSNIGALKVIDAAQGIYAVTATVNTTGSARIAVVWTWPLSKNNPYVSPSQSFTTILAAKATIPTMAGTTRSIGIILQDSTGLIPDATITAIDAGTYLDATAGAFTAYNAAKGLYLVPLTSTNRGRPNNTNSTTSSNETLTLTYHRQDGVEVKVPLPVTIYWANVKVSVEDNWPSYNTTATPIYLTPVGTWLDSKWTFNALSMTNLDGTSVGAAGGNTTNDVATTGKLKVLTNSAFTPQKDVVLFGSANNGYNSTYFYWSDPYEIYRKAYFIWAPTSFRQAIYTGGASAIPPGQLADMEVTITDDLGNLVTGAYVDTSVTPTWSPTQSFNGFKPGSSSGTDWTLALVPKTDGSDGKYYVRLYFNGYYYGITNQTFNFYMSIASTDYPGVSTRLSLTIAVNR